MDHWTYFAYQLIFNSFLLIHINFLFESMWQTKLATRQFLAAHKIYCITFFVHFAGSSDKGAVEVTNCFTVPHNESEDEVKLSLLLRFLCSFCFGY